MSDYLTLPPRRAIARAASLIGAWPCFQTSPDVALIDRSGAGNDLAFGAGLLATPAWANASMVTTAYSVTGTVAGVPFMTAAQQQNFVWGTDTMIVSGWFKAAAPAGNTFLLGNGSSATSRGFGIQALTDGTLKANVYGSATRFGNPSGVLLDNTWHHMVVLIDGPNTRMHVWIDGAYNAAMNGSAYLPNASGLDYSITASIVGTTQANVLQIGGAPNTNSAQQTAAQAYSLSINGSFWGWQAAVLKARGAPTKMAVLAARLYRSALQEMSASELA